MLLNHSWDPEYSTSGTPYGAPFSYNPSAGRPGGNQGNPFGGWPFAETFVWTTWDENGNNTTYSSTGGNPFQGNPFGANPFSWADPFDVGEAHAGNSGSSGAGDRSCQGNQRGGNPFVDSSNPFKGTVFDFSSFFSNAPTAEELLQEAKADLRLDIELIAAKLVILALSFLLSAPATGLYLYTIISIGQGIWKRLNFLSLILLVPFVMLALIFTPGGDAAIGIIALILFACAVGFDISNVCRHVKTIRTLKRS